ncbi:MAG: DNA polymerase III subunit gamma/tau [Candidatus Neomarinimicrobiota bacterium]|nr:DNA polymerase III subunit gamma/tau [Candidatus Neomarinimicrobiota bacterium]
MSYKVLSLKYRPQNFLEVVGQEHVTQTLVNAFKKDRVGQGYIFTGPRGVGKTTTARILAKGLNCKDSKDGNPCNKCNICHEITEYRNLDVLEIDGASNRGIEEIRNLRELIKFTPMNASYKIFIIDEVHMLTNQAFNALLRTLEEPPPHGKFIMCTTDIHKVPDTIISRCQRFDFNRISINDIKESINSVLKKEKLDSDVESIEAIATKSEGSMRDALSILDQVIAFSDSKINFKDVEKILGLVSSEVYFQLTDSIKDKNAELLLEVLTEIRNGGIPVNDVVKGLNVHIRNLMYASLNDGVNVLDISNDLKNKYIESSKLWDLRDLLRITEVINDLEININRSNQPYIMFEITTLKLLEMDQTIFIEELLNKSFAPTGDGQKKNELTDDDKVEKEVNKSIEVDKKKSDELNENLEDSVNTNKENEDLEDNLKIDIDYVKNKWSEIVTAVTDFRTSIGIVMEHSMPIEVEKSILKVGVHNQPKFSLDLLNNNKQVIEEIIIKQLDKKVAIDFSDIQGEDDSIEINEKPLIDNKNKYENSDAMDSVIELFDGEILR